jgi:hypothetical protein
MKISKKSLLVELLSGAQVVTLTVAMLASALWIRSSVQGIAREQIGNDNQLIASQMARLISQSKFESIDFGSSGWERLQTLIEEIELPNDGYMCVADAADGKLVCHPAIVVCFSSPVDWMQKSGESLRSIRKLAVNAWKQSASGSAKITS